MPSSSGPPRAQWFLLDRQFDWNTSGLLEAIFNGNWQAVQGSASGQGVSMSSTGVQDMRLAVDGQKDCVAWAAERDGIEQVYVREYNGSQWQFLEAPTMVMR